MSSNKPPPSPSKPKSPRPKVSNSALEVSEKDIANMGMYSPSGGNKGWSKVSPNFQRLSGRAGEATKIPPANLDDDDDDVTTAAAATNSKQLSTPDDVEAIRKKNQQRLAEVARKKAEREAAAALRKSKRESLSASAQLNYNHSDDEEDEEDVASPKAASRGIVPSHNRRASTGTSTAKSTTDVDDAALQRMSLYSPQRKVKKFENADKGIYSPTSDKKGWTKVAPKITLPESPDL
jgi:hypothetical protein